MVGRQTHDRSGRGDLDAVVIGAHLGHRERCADREAGHAESWQDGAVVPHWNADGERDPGADRGCCRERVQVADVHPQWTSALDVIA